MAIYTKRGDKGETSLYDGDSSQRIRISKDSLRIRAIGALDEANSYLGVVSSLTSDKKLTSQISKIQAELFTIGSILAGARLRFFSSKTKFLETQIDKLEGSLPVLRNFILPGGNPVSAHLHIARTAVRRAEREIVALNEVDKVKPEILTFLNRLSDYLFMLARKVNFETKVKEKVWKR
ncbi:ATP:cob(I)alamin adenosyltransferase [Candidatus Woesebacteria bacterium GWA1_41_8]|uniref:Corrinoid adenosyltransferase n=1 Tax=Candidatus Woesebacteria bacterium GWA1_41_8 TaxID=1802471 RepID=A0A1F7WI63_9BACT|nr:MAG: ATP:cob(I)alamin adenosyltransferase [Candidatus Woesebacteria bacterium GWA1_41_8]